MGPFSRARWARSQSAPPCPGAWSYRILGRFPLPEARVLVERQQQQQQQQQQRRQAPQQPVPVAVPQAGRPKQNSNDGTVQPHPPGCCIHPQYQPANFPPAVPPVPVEAVSNVSIKAGAACPAASRHYIPANTNPNHPIQSPYHQPCYPPQNPLRAELAHVHPTPRNTYPQPQPVHPQGHPHAGYFPPPPPTHHFPTPQYTTPVGNSQRPGILHSHSYPHCQPPHPHNPREYPNSNDPHGDQLPRPHQYTHGPPGACIPQAPRQMWNAVNSQVPDSTSTEPSSHAHAANVPLEGQGTFQRPFIIQNPAEGPNLIRPPSERSYPYSSTGNPTAGTASHTKRQAEQQHLLPPASSNPSSWQHQPPPHPHIESRPPCAGSAPKRTRKSYTREYKLKALNLLKSDRPDGKGGMVPASDTWVSRQVGVTRKVLRGWKAQEERLRASRKGSRRVRVGRNRERRKMQDGGKERSGKGKGKEIETLRALPATSSGDDRGIGSSTPKSPEGSGRASEDEDSEFGAPDGGHSSEDEDESGIQDFHQTPATAVMESDR